MTKKEYCINNPATAYYSGVGGVEIHGIEYGVNDHLYCTCGAWTGKKSYHKLKIQYDSSDRTFIRLHGYKIPLDECIRTGVQ